MSLKSKYCYADGETVSLPKIRCLCAVVRDFHSYCVEYISNYDGAKVNFTTFASIWSLGAMEQLSTGYVSRSQQFLALPHVVHSSCAASPASAQFL